MMKFTIEMSRVNDIRYIRLYYWYWKHGIVDRKYPLLFSEAAKSRKWLTVRRDHLGSPTVFDGGPCSSFHLIFIFFFNFVLCLVFPMFPVSLDCPLWIDPSVSSNIYGIFIINGTMQHNYYQQTIIGNTLFITWNMITIRLITKQEIAVMYVLQINTNTLLLKY